ncbi:MAG: hypothetical protein WB992_23200 [Bryobacteraceae bacterium]
MDVKQYYRKVREVEATVSDPYPLVISLETSDGGKAGRGSEVSRELAAKLIVEGRAVLANEKDKELYHQRQAAMKKAADKVEFARRVQVAIVSDSDLQSQSSAYKSNDLPLSGK